MPLRYVIHVPIKSLKIERNYRQSRPPHEHRRFPTKCIFVMVYEDIRRVTSSCGAPEAELVWSEDNGRVVRKDN